MWDSHFLNNNQEQSSQVPNPRKRPRYLQDSCLRARTSVKPTIIVYPQPIQSSTPIPDINNNYYWNNGSSMNSQQQSYSNYAKWNSNSGLNHTNYHKNVLPTYVPGATVLCMDSKETKPKSSPNVRSILATIICLAFFGGATTFLLCIRGGFPEPITSEIPTTGPLKDLSLPIGNSERLKLTEPSAVPTMMNSPHLRSEPINVKRANDEPQGTKIIFSFDDNDSDNEAHVETLW